MNEKKVSVPPHKEIVRVYDEADSQARLWKANADYPWFGNRERALRRIAKEEPWARCIIVGAIVERERGHLDHDRYKELRAQADSLAVDDDPLDLAEISNAVRVVH